MTAKVNIANHPVHPMLVAFPIGLWVFSLAADVIYFAGGGPAWATVAWYTMGGGIVGAVAAALPGFIDLLAMKESEAKRLGSIHAILNMGALILFVADFFLRGNNPPNAVTFILSALGVLTITVSGWLGGSMIYEYGAAVELAPDAEQPPEQWKKAA